MKRNILFFGGGNLPRLRAAAERRGFDIVLVNYQEMIDRLEPVPSIVHIEGVDVQNLMATQRRIVELHRRFDFAGIVPIAEYGLMAAAMAARAVGLPHVPLEAVANTRDKVRMRRVLESKGLGQVGFRACRTPDEAARFLDEVGGPIIVKPLAGTASDGVSRVDRHDQLVQAWRTAGGARAFGGVICEEYIDGPEVSVEAYCVDGEFVPVAITDKMTDARFLEIGHSQPTNLSRAVQDQIFDVTRTLTLALGITHGVTHTEMRLTSNGPKLIETHTRMGGGHIPTLTNVSTGVDLADVVVASAIGEKPAVRPRDTATAAAIRFVTGPAGVITNIELPKRENGIEDVRCYLNVGDVTTGRSASFDRFGHVIVTGRTRDEADALAENAVTRFRVDIEAVRETVAA
ncbi:MAG TPA: ATP-grasp domain-containing protein [Thermoanaerobaculia bacterium]|jgi:biotin carboxylase